MMLKENTYEKLALANAKAIQGLQPKITVWNTGDQTSSGANGEGILPIKNIMQSLPPLLSTVQEQTGFALPNWMMQTPQANGSNGQNGHLEASEKKKLLDQFNAEKAKE
jgi:flotillin